MQLHARSHFVPRFYFVRDLAVYADPHTLTKTYVVNSQNDRETDGYSAVDYIQCVVYLPFSLTILIVRLERLSEH